MKFLIPPGRSRLYQNFDVANHLFSICKRYNTMKFLPTLQMHLHHLWKRAVRIAGKPRDNYRSPQFLQPFSIDSADSPCRDPAIPSPHSFHGAKICSAVLLPFSGQKFHGIVWSFLTQRGSTILDRPGGSYEFRNPATGSFTFFLNDLLF